MSYGQNQPWGLKAIKTVNGATWNGQTSQYLIQSGYPNNIFRGDLVYLQGGYIRNLSDLGAYPSAQAIGVFNGCSFTTPTSINPIDPASPGRQFWPAGTVTPGGVPATCDIIDDPNVIYNIQVAGGPTVPPAQTPSGSIAITDIGRTASVAYSYVQVPLSTTNPTGNFQTGISSLVLDTGTLGNADNLNLRILRLVPDVNNAFGINFNNVEVLIQNHSFASRPAGLP